MKCRLLVQACIKFFVGLLMFGMLLFWPAGTLRFWKAWLLAAVLFIPMFIAGIILLLKSPELLSKRLNAKETQNEQKQVILFSLFMFIGGFLIAGFDFKYGWSKLPDWVSIAAAAVFVISYGLYGEVMRENAYLSRTIEVQKGQKVIDTGLYGIVRHPMYFATVLLFLSMPFVLGSVYAFLIFLIYPFILVKRIKNEEGVLKTELSGYTAYTEKVRYRLIPFIW